ncbi:uncharacterized protein [Aquarana catesbeiana]|uniref:uncharacterized protein isoform X5 n=1 Tax=Aquarana catesbeiana TaxID=8400 RepID=UPI003CC9435F
MSPVTSVLPILFLCYTALYADNSKETTKSKDIDKPGSCPVPPERCFKAPRLDGICTKDQQCPGHQKCCVRECEYACIEPEKLEKSGQCPHVGPPGTLMLYKCPSVNTTACVNDVDCEGHQKCCSESCVNKCRDPVGEPTVVEKSGQCPHVGPPGAVIRYACKSVNTTACVNDVDCEGHQKCCSEFCVNKCQEPMDKPGSCPVPPERCLKAPRLDGICTKDHQCPGHQKCCVRLCEYDCVAPEKFEKSGQCPYVGLPGTFMLFKCPSVNTTACVNDVDCEGHQKCCSELCVNKCRDPVGEPTVDKPGSCPVPPERCFKAPRLDGICTKDHQCPGQQKCCVRLCEYDCVAPEKFEKSGECPHVGPPGTFIRYACKSVNTTACVNDADCEGHQKCCSEFCVNKCREPMDKPGSCPVPPERCLKAPRLDGICTKDHQCPGQQKCCVRLCEYDCVAPEKFEKSGECPHVGPPGTFIRYACKSVNTTACVNDADCEGHQKCCSEFCVNKCREPMDKPGSCPVPPERCLKAPRLDGICTKDHQCPGQQKCCVRLCEYDCVAPEKFEKSGECPHVGPPGTFIRYSCKSVNTTACVNDADCEGHQKCCSEFCVNKCREPMDKPGSCPVPPERCLKAPRLDGICTKDHQCPGQQKCCVRLCEYDCVAPEKFEKSGECPHVGPPGTFIRYACKSVNTTACVNDADCEGHQKCCSEFCVNKCREPMDKPGSCPVPPERCLKAPRLDGICTKDHQCPGQQKCCVRLCEYDCVAPEKFEKGGECPHVGPPGTVIRYACKSVNTTACVNDVDCEGHQKCCSEFCVNKCREPMDKPGTCPVPPERCFKAPRLDGICTKDHQCPGHQKCCVRLCEYDCVSPEKFKKSGQCPHVGPPGTFMLYKCPSVNTTACVNDVDCKGHQKCCSESCVNKCRDPMGQPTVVEKSGECPHVLPPGIVIRYACKSVNTTACVNDVDCEGHQKCCSEFCVNKCREPMDKPGTCPVPPERCLKAPRLDGICTKDHQCPGHQKCCVRLCEYDCVGPEKFQKSGQCPHVGLPGTVMQNTCQSVNTSACVNDVDCEGQQKCCNELCVNKCRDPMCKPSLGRCKGQKCTLCTLRKKG